MKVIKRDGSIVDYDRSKISTAIQKANDEVPEEDRLSQDRIDAIIDRIEELKRPRILVEDIQDLVEQGLVAENKFHLAKTYIIYRYNRALVRKANTTDESILSLLRNENKELAEENSNKNTMIAATQRDYIAGEVSRDLTRRILLPEYISKAHDEGAIHFHDADYFVQPIFNCCLINIGDMLDNGTVMNGKLIESPKSFQHRYHTDHRLRGLQPVRRSERGHEPSGQIPAPQPGEVPQAHLLRVRRSGGRGHPGTAGE